MSTKVKAVYEGGVFRPLEPLDLIEKTPGELTIEPLPQRGVVDETHGLMHIDPEIARVIAEDPLFALWGEAACPWTSLPVRWSLLTPTFSTTILSACRDCPQHASISSTG